MKREKRAKKESNSTQISIHSTHKSNKRGAFYYWRQFGPGEKSKTLSLSLSQKNIYIFFIHINSADVVVVIVFIDVDLRFRN